MGKKVTFFSFPREKSLTQCFDHVDAVFLVELLLFRGGVPHEATATPRVQQATMLMRHVCTLMSNSFPAALFLPKQVNSSNADTPP
jgi:hypothetical protein